jgi:hypothetical protein
MTWTISKMITRFRPLNALRCLGALALLLCGSSAPRAQNLPVFTSPIDITGLKVQLRIFALDRESGKPVSVALPPGLFGPKMNQFFSAPLSAQFDQYWNAKDPKGKTVREAACEGEDGIKQQVVKEAAKIGYSAYDISCDLAYTGQLVAKQVGSTMILAYLLTNNTVSFASTSPYTCQAGSGSPFCPNNPRFTVHFATEIVTDVRTPGLCQLFADDGTVYVVAASFDFHNAAADIAHFVVGQKFVAAEAGITNTVRNRPLPLDDSFKELRTGDACTGKTPGASRIITAFGDLETEIDLRQGIILRASHVGIAAPSLNVPLLMPVQSFFRPMISTTQPLVRAGNTMQLIGQHFPLNTNLATALPVALQHEGISCFGGATDLEWGRVGGPLRVQQLQGDAQGGCAGGYDAANLTPNTAYQFRARDCDLITCSPWSVTLKVTTAKTDATNDKVVLTLDGSTPLGTATVNAKGNFETSITIPAGTSVGAHTIHAVIRDAKADATIQVTAPGSKASIMMVGVLTGETGCPNHPISSTQTDDTFMLFGAGFAAGTVAIHLDTTTGATLGAAMGHADGSICQQMQSPPATTPARTRSWPCRTAPLWRRRPSRSSCPP